MKLVAVVVLLFGVASAAQSQRSSNWEELDLPVKGESRFDGHTYKWVVQGKAATFYFTPALVAAEAVDGDPIVAAVRHVLEHQFRAERGSIEKPVTQEPFLVFRSSAGTFYVRVMYETNGEVRAFGVAKR